MELTVIILCGGHGTRIKSIIGETPKILAPVAESFFIEYLLKWLVHSLNTVRHEIILSTGIGHAAVETYSRNNRLACVICKEEEPLGTLGAVIHVIKKNQLNGDILVINGDTIFDVDFAQVYERFLNEEKKPLLIVKATEKKGRYGGYKLDNDGFLDLCSSNAVYISLGAFFATASYLCDYGNRKPVCPKKGLMLDEDFLCIGKVNPYILDSDIRFIDIGIPSDLDKSQTYIPQLTEGWRI